MTTLETKANEYAQTLHPIDIDEVSVIVRDFCAGYTEAQERHAAEMQALKEKAVEAVNTALCYNGCSKGKYCEEPCERRDLIIKKLNEK